MDVTVGWPSQRSRNEDLNRLKNIKQDLVNAVAVERFQNSPQPLPSRYTKWITQINHAWREFYPDDPGEFHVGLHEVALERNTGAFDVIWTRSNDTAILIDLLSAGQLELFIFISELVLNDDREGIVFIDEPELHLDPQWHRPIIRCLTKLQPRAQFIVATHSPEIYDAARSYERHFLVPDDDPRARLWRREQPVEA